MDTARPHNVLFCWLWLCSKLANVHLKTNVYNQQQKKRLPVCFSSTVLLGVCQCAYVTVLTY